MTLLTKYNADVFGWQRKPGPLRVWTVVDGRKKTANGEIPKFSIQEIPEDRYEEVLHFLSSVLTQDEPMSRCLGIYKDPEAIKDFQKLWSLSLQQGIAVGAFLIEPNNPKPLLAGVNMTFISCAASEKNMERQIKITSRKLMTLMKFVCSIKDEIDTCKFYNVDKYLTAFGLTVDRAFRGQGLANHLLGARDMMSKVYDVQVTSNFFSGSGALKAAANVGLENLLQRNFSDARDEEGNELFPGIQEKVCRFMAKRFLS